MLSNLISSGRLLGISLEALKNPKWNRIDPDRKFRRLIAWTQDNEKFLPPDYIPGLFAQFGDNVNMIRAHIFGEFCPLVGKAAAPEFKQHHVIKCKPDTYSPLIFSWDFNVDPLSWVVLQERWVELPDFKRKRIIVVVANSSGNSSIVADGTVEFIYQFKDSKFKNARIQIDGDSQGHRRNPIGPGTPFTIAKEILRDHNFFNVEIVAHEYNPPEEDTIDAVNSALMNNVLYFDERCENAIRSMQASQLIPGKKKLLKTPNDRTTHWFDAVKYPVFRLLETMKLSKIKKPKMVHQ